MVSACGTFLEPGIGGFREAESGCGESLTSRIYPFARVLAADWFRMKPGQSGWSFGDLEPQERRELELTLQRLVELIAAH